jgi:DNA polymerase-3 subunit epsilon
MRQIVLDTETTGLEPGSGHRVIEIGCIELVERRPTGRVFHHYLNPERAIDQGALEVHGITEEFLRDKPRFADIAAELVAFVSGAELVIHNAAFDLAFLDHELGRLQAGHPPVAECASVLDTLALARERFPGQKNSLDALCKRLGVDASRRELHGALLDASLLADVYLALTAGQGALEFGLEAAPQAARVARALVAHVLVLRRAGAEDVAAHAARLAVIERQARAPALWRRYEHEPAAAVPA